MKYCQNCGEPSPLEDKYCRHCGVEIEAVAEQEAPAQQQRPRPVRRTNRTDEGIKDIWRSKTLKVFLGFIFVFLFVLPISCLCLGLLGFIPLTDWIIPLLSP